MPRDIEMWLDVGSPAAYLAFTQLEALEARTGARVVVKPMLLGGVFKTTGNASPITVEAKGRWMMRDLSRYAEAYGVPFTVSEFFPINTLPLMRAAAGLADDQSALRRYLSVVFHAIWAEGRNMGDPAVIAAALSEGGLDAEGLMASTQDPVVKQRLMALTEEACARGVFGAPTFFVGDEMFWGQDRLDWVERWAAA